MTEIQNVAYVRPEGEYLTEQAPPRSSEGIIGWMNANLFATWSDRIVTFKTGGVGDSKQYSLSPPEARSLCL